MLAATPGAFRALLAIDTATDTVQTSGAFIDSVAVTTTKRKYRVTLKAQAGGPQVGLMPIGTILTTAGVGARALLVSFVSDQVYDVEVVDWTGAAADGAGLAFVAWLGLNSMS